MSQLLHIGTRADGHPMTLPADLGDKKIALVAQSNKGKTYGLGDILEELCKARRPFIATDPANNLWGLRVKPDGTPSGLPVVVIGGPHGDIPIEKDAGERVAEALLATPLCTVIDLSMETGGSKRRFMTDFAQRLIRTRCEVPMPIFLEEAPDLIPQRAVGPQMEICKAAISKLATIGGNFGYGVFPATQRPATLDKDVLSQCEALIVMGITHTPDRKTIASWIEAKDIGGRVDAMFAELGSLAPGQAWLWWPGEDRFEKFTFRKRETLHPREMKRLGLKPGGVELGDADAFVLKLKRELGRVASACPAPKDPKTRAALVSAAEHAAAGRQPGAIQEASRAVRSMEDQRDVARTAQAAAEEERDRISEELQKERGLRAAAERRLAAVREYLKPQHDALQKLFGDLGPPASGAAVDRSAWEPWLAKAGASGCKRLLEILIQKGRLKMRQLATLAGVAYGNGTWCRYKSWLVSNSLVAVEGDEIALVEL